MVRKYERIPGSTNYQNYKKEDLEKALDSIRSGMSKKLAIKTYKILRTTPIRKIRGTHLKAVGRPKVFSDQEEAKIATTLGIVADWGFPLTKRNVSAVVQKFLDKQGKRVPIFKNNIPGDDFLIYFMTRNNLSIRIASNIKQSRASVDQDDIMSFFNNIREVLRDVEDVNLYNYDETNIQDDPGAKKVVYHAEPKELRGYKITQEHL
ncbi:hypothetical protein NQ314_004296 [Rhamnusium bicolor]|uniref:Uncharacterized protein n=1 Tax=Rhamnusium bicolor TaxID=1586634 RepID=A0AAV8ZJW6_9CUCU|nr:hypothetical protein NQ314_004296 [Rhamnusium bicolor]